MPRQGYIKHYPRKLEQADVRVDDKTEDSLKRGSPKEERVVQHTPSEEKEACWYYNLVEGGKKYKAILPTSDEMIEKIKKQLLNPNTWSHYHVNPYGSNFNRNYTNVICFPPFEVIRVADVYFPNNTIYKSSLRRIVENEET